MTPPGTTDAATPRRPPQVRPQGAPTLARGAWPRPRRISASFLSLVEKDRSDITIGRLVRLIEFYGISITDLLPGEAASG